MKECFIDGKRYRYSEKWLKHYEDNCFLGFEDARELAINKELMRQFRLREKSGQVKLECEE